jgi:hypothetical protein
MFARPKRARIVVQQDAGYFSIQYSPLNIKLPLRIFMVSRNAICFEYETPSGGYERQGEILTSENFPFVSLVKKINIWRPQVSFIAITQF